MHKNLFGIAAILFGLAALVLALPTSQAQDFGPVVTGSDNPWLSFSGYVSGQSATSVYTVPADRSFVLTGACTDSEQVDLRGIDALGNDTLRLEGNTYAMHCIASGGPGGPPVRGEARIVYTAGSQVRVSNGHSVSRPYFIQGYLAAP